MESSVEQFFFEKLSARHRSRLLQFENQETDLVDYLRHDALSQQAQGISATYLLFGQGALIGYVTLLADGITIKEDRALVYFFGKKGIRYATIPALKIGRLAVSCPFQKKGFGTKLVSFAIGTACGISERIGCRLISVDAKDSARAFYGKRGFIPLQHGKRQRIMYLDLIAAAAK
ncbi:MAG: GNAT family N-acetyltransferase [Candidatus Micrarchaeia archaeon]